LALAHWKNQNNTGLKVDFPWSWAFADHKLVLGQGKDHPIQIPIALPDEKKGATNPILSTVNRLTKLIWKDLLLIGLLKSKSTTEVLSKSKKPTWKPPKETENSSRFLPRKKEGI